MTEHVELVGAYHLEQVWEDTHVVSYGTFATIEAARNEAACVMRDPKFLRDGSTLRIVQRLEEWRFR